MPQVIKENRLIIRYAKKLKRCKALVPGTPFRMFTFATINIGIEQLFLQTSSMLALIAY